MLSITAAFALNYEKIGKSPERMIKIKLFVDKYNCKGLNYPIKG